MLSLPSITAADIQAFEEAVAKTCSPKEQKQHMKSLLLLAAGTRLKALASHKNTNVITNVSGKFHYLVSSFSRCDIAFLLLIVFMNVLHFSHVPKNYIRSDRIIISSTGV